MPTIRDQELDLQKKLAEVRALALATSPISEDMAASAPTWRAAYSDRTSALMAALCLIAYDHFEDASGSGLDAMRVRLAKGGFRLINTYDPRASTQAYLAVSDQFAVLAFRGTTDATDWKSNLNAALMPLDPERPKLKVHTGFLQAFREVEHLIRADLETHVPPTLGFYITGHSLGGAVAQIAAAALARENLAACYTFGSPRVAGHSFDTEVKCPHYRVVNAADLVPGVPPPVWRGYYHNGDVRWLNRQGDPPTRYGRHLIQQAIKTVGALIAFAFIRKLFIIEDHMIWNYEAKLSAVAGARAPVTTPARTVMQADEIQARLLTAAFAAVRRKEATLQAGVVAQFTKTASDAAARIIKATPSGRDRAAHTTQGELAFEDLVSEMVDMARKGRAPGKLTVAVLKSALARLSPYPPIC
jgi:triacylglycerol lipase